VASGALPKTGAERVCGNGLSQHVAVSELEDDGHRIGRCASRFLCLLRHDDLHPSTPGIVCVIPGIGALWLFQHELLGISIDAGTLTMPTKANLMDAGLVVSATNFVAVRGAPIDIVRALVRV
jgi:hypothetical protein